MTYRPHNRRSPDGAQAHPRFGAHLAQFDRYLVEQRLRPIPYLANVPGHVLAAMARRLAPVVVSKGEQVVEACQAPDALYIIERGRSSSQGATRMRAGIS